MKFYLAILLSLAAAMVSGVHFLISRLMRGILHATVLLFLFPPRGKRPCFIPLTSSFASMQATGFPHGAAISCV